MDQQAINTVRILAADVVQGPNSGHPGAPMGLAPAAHVLFSKFVTADPQSPQWINRDRFILSNGHACALLYIYLHLLGYNVSMDDLKNFRRLGSKTPGHPEANHGLPGVEVSTGPLGQGISNAVGIALAESHLAARFNKQGYELFNNYTYVFTGDGCLQEGVHAEAVSLAGHLKLGKLIVIYDDNHITIDGDTNVSFTEDVLKRFESYGWHTLTVSNGDEDLASIEQAIAAAKAVTDKPSIIKMRTTIGFGSLKQGEEKVHGSPLGADDIVQLKKKLGFSPEQHYQVSPEVYNVYKAFGERGSKAHEAWNLLLNNYKKAYPELGAELDRRLRGELPTGWKDLLPKYSPSDAPVATRKLSENTLNKIADALPELIGGSADLTASNLTRWKTAKDYQASGNAHGAPDGRYIRFGVREHGMAAICNGMASYGSLIPFGATFFNFISYALGAVRLSALSKHHVLYIMTHDSIGLGEDGPTHQPIETMAEIRAMPNILSIRPADGNEVSGAYAVALENNKRPSVIILTRQNLPQLAGSSIESVYKGAYTLQSVEQPHLILVATGSEVSLAVETAKVLAKQNIKANVVSMPCWELFEEQDAAYKAQVFPKGIPILSIEAMSTYGWDRYAHACVGLDTFGASGKAEDLFKHFGFTPDAVAKKATVLLEFYKNRPIEWKLERPF